MMGEKLTTAQIKPRHEVKTSPTTRLPKGTMPCCVLPGFAPPRTWSASRPKCPPSSMMALVLFGLVQSSTGASPMKGDSGALPAFTVCVVPLCCPHPPSPCTCQPPPLAFRAAIRSLTLTL